MSTGPNMEAVDYYLDGQDLAAKQDDRHEGDRPSSAYGGQCSVCGDVVAKTIKGVCGECRQLEGSVWQYEWGG